MEHYSDSFESLQAIKDYPQWMQWLISNFQWYDDDQNGLISLGEFESLCTDYPSISRSDLVEIDKSGDGMISMSEFMSWAWEHETAFVNCDENCSKAEK